MKRKILFSVVALLSFGLHSFAMKNNKLADTTLTKRVEALELKLKSQQKEINTLKETKKVNTIPTKQSSTAQYIIDRRGSKQFMKVQ